jgi:hypothetical protein
MMRSLSGFILVLLLAVAPPLEAHAVRVHSIYQAEIPVASESEEDKLIAEQAALAEVFIKISGNSHILDNNPNLKSSLTYADSLVEEYSYSTPLDAPKETPSVLFVRFDAEGVNKLLREAGSPVWGENRPLILVWLALQTLDKSAEIVDGSMGELLPMLKQTAKQRGLPVIFPMMDVTDVTQVSVNDIGAKSITTLLQASKRYDSNAILIGKVTQTSGDYMSHWILVLGADRWSWDVTGSSMQDVMTGIVDNVTDALANRYGMVVSTAVQAQVTLTIHGFAKNADLLRIMRYLQHLTPVTEVQLMTVVNSDITFNVSLHGSKEAFIQALASGKTLAPVSVANLADGNIEYKLTP